MSMIFDVIFALLPLALVAFPIAAFVLLCCLFLPPKEQ